MKRVKTLFLLLLLSVPFTMRAQNIYLVSVGVADYRGFRDDLFLSVHDAEAIFELYESKANTSSVILTNSHAKRNLIMTEAKKLFSKAGQNDIVVFYFSGHGYPGGFNAYDGDLTYEDIRQIFSGCKARNKMVFADACFSGDIRDNTGNGFNDPKNSILLFLSSRSGETSLEHPKLRNGFFTTCLLRSLKGGADSNRDRIITAKELFTAVSSGVRRLSKNNQHPVMWGNFDDTMPVMIWK